MRESVRARWYTGSVLRELRIENLLLIERAELRLGEGLNAITGETGAGKTVLAHSLGLLMGGKAKGKNGRQGEGDHGAAGGGGGVGRGLLRPARRVDRRAGADGVGRAPAGGRRGDRAGAAGLLRRPDQRFRRRARRERRGSEAARREAARLLRAARAPAADDLLGAAGDPRRLRRCRASADAAGLPRGGPGARTAGGRAR